MGIASTTTAFAHKIDAKYHINWLNMLLWGGSAGLALEHVAHGEIVGSFPFLTAVSEGNTMGMLGEIATTGTAMVAACVATWAVMVWVANRHSADASTKAATQ